MLRDPPRSTLFPYTTPSDLASPAARRRGPPPRPAPSRSRARRRAGGASAPRPRTPSPDRKSTRLNSSHVEISYAVFCLKKKNYYPKLTHLISHSEPHDSSAL